jgi:hypothetical protein
MTVEEVVAAAIEAAECECGETHPTDFLARLAEAGYLVVATPPDTTEGQLPPSCPGAPECEHP